VDDYIHGGSVGVLFALTGEGKVGEWLLAFGNEHFWD